MVLPNWVPYASYREKLFKGTAKTLEATPGLRMIAATAAFNPEASTYSTYADITTWTVTDASGFAAKGEAIANETVTLVTANGTVASDFDDVTFASSASGPTNIRYVNVVLSAAVTANMELVAWASTGSDKSVQSGSLTVNIDADGFIIST